MTLTDKIAIFTIVFYGLMGWRNGAWKSIVGPISLALSLGAAYFYYQTTHQMLWSILICAFGPFAFHFILLALLYFAEQNSDKDVTFSVRNRFVGICVSVAWAVCLLGFFIFCFLFVPPQPFGLEEAREDVVNSALYFSVKRFFPFEMKEYPLALSHDEEALSDMQETTEYQDLMRDEKIQSVISDEKIVEQIRNKNFVELMKNPKVLEIMKDQELLMKFYNLQKQAFEGKKSDATK